LGRRERDECFGLPNSGAIAGIVFGILIIIWGLSALLGWEINLMAFIVIIFGTLIVAGAIYTLTRKSR
jgi:amino acid transporter